MISILQVTAALEQGGVERGTVEMAGFVVAQGAKSYVASQGGQMVAELERQGTTHFFLPLAKRNPFSIIYSACRLALIIRQEKIDLVHARSRAPAWAAYLASLMTGVKFVTTFHGTHRIQNRFKRFYNSSMVRGERVIAISRFVRGHILENYGVSADRIDLAPRGFDPKKFNRKLVSEEQLESLKREFSLADNVPVICLPGRLTRWKGQVLFIEALAQIKNLSWQAIIVGGSDQKTTYLAELRSLVEKNGLSKRVIFAGSQSNITPFYALSDVVVSASTEPEAFGRVAVEAQAMGLPVVVSDHGGSLETVRDKETGLLFRSSDVIDLSTKIKELLMTPELRKVMGQRGKIWVSENYTTVQMCMSEWQTYEKILNI